MEETKIRNSINEGEYDEYAQKEKRDRAKLTIIIAGGILIIAVLILIFANSESHYDKGVKYLNQKQYTEALSEFQKVDASDDDFPRAQSKINYIKGLEVFNNGLKTEAKSYLVRVDPGDEYYHDAQLMIEKIDLANKQGDIEKLSEAIKQSKDTVIIKEKITDPKQTVGDAGNKTQTNIEDVSKVYISSLGIMVKKFESLYQTARTSDLNLKKKYARDMDSLYNKLLQLDNSIQINNTAAELKQLSNMYMEKRMEYINMQVTQNSDTEINDMHFIREDGDKLYSKILNRL